MMRPTMADRPINLRDWQVRAAVEGRLSVLVVPMRSMRGTTLEDFVWEPAGDGVSQIGHLPLDKLVAPLIVGERYWTREKFATQSIGGARTDFIHYAATPETGRFLQADLRTWADDKPTAQPTGWRSSTQLPRWASRITIVPTSVRVCRLHDLTRDETIGTGVITDEWREWRADAETIGLPPGSRIEDEIDAFAKRWDTRDGPTAWNGPGAYERNPWVAVARCAVHLRNIDKESEHG